jgi:hypothetical protein
MHKIIYLIVKGKDESEAWKNLEELRYQICDEKKWYDYGSFFTEEDSSAVSGKGRWGNLVPIAKLNSKDGNLHLKNAFKTIENQFIRSLEEIKKCIEEYTPKEIYDGEVTEVKSKIIESLRNRKIKNEMNRDDNFTLTLFRYHARQLHDSESYGWIYILEKENTEAWVEGFENEKEFNVRFSHRDKNEYWIAPMDVHF